ncbi:hypothetical protein NGM33_06920 [Nocardiopsis dassonvillei]|uniref:hypothetical protein n=1 Tax=Nocardiopsis dassonvillei TaxID=2014 RepID=UPI0020A2B363|nr:hypothetical protein [Nocardiopsis dassonvillei]MCP3013060.1 hypothetical protein [Nocardiopsis dassonvillei]
MPLEELTRVARRFTFRALTPEERRAHLLVVGEEEGHGASEVSGPGVLRRHGDVVVAHRVS